MFFFLTEVKSSWAKDIDQKITERSLILIDNVWSTITQTWVDDATVVIFAIKCSHQSSDSTSCKTVYDRQPSVFHFQFSNVEPTSGRSHLCDISVYLPTSPQDILI